MPGSFDIRLEQMAPSSWGLHIRNSGATDIPELDVELDGIPVHEHPAFVQNQPDRGHVEGLPGEAEVAYLLMSRDDASRPPYRLRIVHTDADGVTHEYSSRIG